MKELAKNFNFKRSTEKVIVKKFMTKVCNKKKSEFKFSNFLTAC